jgi:hypothetical protein
MIRLCRAPVSASSGRCRNLTSPVAMPIWPPITAVKPSRSADGSASSSAGPSGVLL